MPQAILPIIEIVAAATTIGTGIYSMTQQPGGGGDTSGNQQAMVQQEDADAEKQRVAFEQSRAQMARRVAPDVQAATGGSLTDNAFSQMVANLSGNPGDLEAIKSAIFPGNSGGNNETGIGLGDAQTFLSNPLQGGEGHGEGGSGISLTEPYN